MSSLITRRTMLAGGMASLLAAPWAGRAQANTLRIGMQSILSGPIALLGTSSRNALLIEQDRINAAGRLLGRQIEFVFRDSRGQ
jgi:branched-chain amino acid transport system substrate-binding protein